MGFISRTSTLSDERSSAFNKETPPSVLAQAIMTMIYVSIGTSSELAKPSDSDSSTACDTDNESAEFNEDASSESSDLERLPWRQVGARLSHSLASCWSDSEVAAFADSDADVSKEHLAERVDIAAWRVAGARVHYSIAECMQDPEVTAFADDGEYAPRNSNSLAYSCAADLLDEIAGVKAWSAASTRISRSFLSCLDDPEVTAFADVSEDVVQMPSTIVDERMDTKALGDVNRRISESIALCIAEEDSEVQLVEQKVDVAAWRVAGSRIYGSLLECMEDPEVTAFIK